jgi:hypothetical protein
MNTLDTSMHGRDLWMRSTEEKGLATYSEHRVWDAERFVAARQADAARLNDKHGTDKASAEQITRDQYLKGRK